MRAFLRKKNQTAEKRAGIAIVKSIQLLVQQPEIATRIEDMAPGFRELAIDFDAIFSRVQ